MKRYAPILPACAAVLLLCAGAHQAAQAAPGRWSALTPLIAGTYGGKSGGSCTAQPALDDGTAAAIRVTPNGKVRAPGIDIDVTDSAIANIERRRTASGYATSVALVDGQASIAIGQVEGQALAQTRDGQHAFSCEGVRLPATLAKQALALTLARMLDTKDTIACSASPNGKTSPLAFALTRGHATLGEHVLRLADASDELITRGPDGVLKYHANLPDGRALIVYYEESGKVRNVAILHLGEDVIGCGPDA